LLAQESIVRTTVLTAMFLLFAAGAAVADTGRSPGAGLDLELLEQPPVIPGTPDLTFNPQGTPPAPETPPHFVHNRDASTVHPDILFPFEGRYELTTRAAVGGDPGSVEVTRAGLFGNLVFGPEKDLQISLPVDWEVSTYSFRDADGVFPGGSTRIRNVQQIVFAPNVDAMINDEWGIFAGGLLIDAGQFSATDTTTYGGFGGVIWKPDKSFNIHLGVGARTRLEDDVQILPTIRFLWKIDERTRLSSNTNNIRFEYDINEAWTIKFDAAVETRAYRFNDSSPGAKGVFRDVQYPVTARVEFVPHPMTRFEAWVGTNVDRQFTVDLEKDVRYNRSHAAPSLLVGVSFDILF
jgi:hypothetical protein